MNVTLIHPPSSEIYKKFKRKPIKRLPIGLAYIAANIEKAGHTTNVIDAESDDLNLNDIQSILLSQGPDAIGITCTTPLFPIASKIADMAKQICPNSKIILGGPHINALAEESLSLSKNADFVVIGEGDITFIELINALNRPEEYDHIPGIGYRKKGEIIINKTRPMVETLDDLPFPAREKFPLEKYRDPDKYNEPYTLLVTSRGCPYKCIFCGSAATWGRTVRFRSADNVIEEIDEIVNKYHIRNITFSDDTFTLKKDRMIKICEKIVQNKYNINFICSSRINTIDEERLTTLAAAGCREITFGVESGDANIIKIISKNINLQDVKPAFDLVKKFGIRVHSSYIIGNPEDTHETINKTINFAIKSGTDAAQFSLSTPYPGTPLWQMAIEKKKLNTNNYAQFKWYYSVVANLSKVSDEDLIHYQKKAYQKFSEVKNKMAC